LPNGWRDSFPTRDPSRVTHSFADMIRARIVAICCGNEDADDLDFLRANPAFALPLMARQSGSTTASIVRGQAENLIKLDKTQPCSDRTSCRTALPIRSASCCIASVGWAKGALAPCPRATRKRDFLRILVGTLPPSLCKRERKLCPPYACWLGRLDRTVSDTIRAQVPALLALAAGPAAPPDRCA
jgi:hypothetical protein